MLSDVGFSSSLSLLDRMTVYHRCRGNVKRTGCPQTSRVSNVVTSPFEEEEEVVSVSIQQEQDVPL